MPKPFGQYVLCIGVFSGEAPSSQDIRIWTMCAGWRWGMKRFEPFVPESIHDLGWETSCLFARPYVFDHLQDSFVLSDEALQHVSQTPSHFSVPGVVLDRDIWPPHATQGLLVFLATHFTVCGSWWTCELSGLREGGRAEESGLPEHTGVEPALVSRATMLFARPTLLTICWLNRRDCATTV